MGQLKKTAVQICGLTLCYPGDKPLFTDYGMEVYEGETLALSGQSGAGKSTLLNCICGVIPGSVKAEISGDILLWDKPVGGYSRAEMARYVGVVFQNPDTQLFCDSVEDELAFGLENLLLSREDMSARIDEALAFTGLESHRYTSPNQLSGGQKQMVVLAAVMAMCPRLLLLDEALSQLDTDASAQMLGAFSRLQKQGQTIVMVDHDPDNLAIAHRVLVL